MIYRTIEFKKYKINSNAASIINIHILIYYDDQFKTWVAYCLELNLVTESKRQKNVIKYTIDLIRAHVNYALENNNWCFLWSFAPKPYWDKYNYEQTNKNNKIYKGNLILKKHTNFSIEILIKTKKK